MDALVQAVPLAAEDAIPVLHTERGAGQAVVLGDGNVDDFVRFQKRLKDGPFLQDITAEIHFPEFFGLGEKDIRTLKACRFGDTGALETAARIVAAHVGNDDLLSAGCPALDELELEEPD